MNNNQLTKDEKLFLDHFWNRKKGAPIEAIPMILLEFLESGDLNIAPHVKLRVIQKLKRLSEKGYIERDNVNLDVWKLTREGHFYFKTKHNPLRERLYYLIEVFPPVLIILSQIIGLGAAVFTIWVIFWPSKGS